MHKIVTLITLIGVATVSQAGSVHQHGIANVNIAISKQALVIELDTPADNLLGFEYQPRTEQQKQHLSNSLLLLKQVDSLFNIPSSANCKIQQVDIKSPFVSDNGKETEHDDHEEHDKHTENTHDEHEEQKKHEEPETHSDFEILYTYDCQQSSQLSRISMAGLFKHFPNFTELKVQWVNKSRQSAKTVTKEENQVDFNE